MSFDYLDDICLAVSNGGISLSDLPHTKAIELGPLLELSHTLTLNHGASENWLSNGIFDPLLKAHSSMNPFYSEDSVQLGYVPIDDLKRIETAETDFCIRANRAAVSVGFTKPDAAKLVAAIVELYTNAIEHSKSIEAAYVAFAAHQGNYEFVVADKGIGVLESLKTNPNYSELEDSGSAMELALTEGISRHDHAPDRGRGFRPVFIGLANISQSIRFRSNDHSHELVRLSDGSIPAFTKQKANLDGFFCSVMCRNI